jgi:ribulose-bisphosphate carboxylase large chain
LISKDAGQLILSGERFEAIYRIRAADAAEAQKLARAICVEQTVEFPPELIDDAVIRNGIVGEIASLEQTQTQTQTHRGSFDAVIGYPVEAAGAELTQLINVLFGNVSIQPGIELIDFRLPDSLLREYPGPRFGLEGLRALLDVHHRPLLCTALKPMGLSATALAALAYRLALGGIDLIKDDHGLADQAFCPFDQRVAHCAAAVQRANHDTGRNALYLPNVTAPHAQIDPRARLARDAGVGGLLFCPGLAGLDAMRTLADDDDLALPIMSHPAFQGGLVSGANTGLSHRVLYGRLNRLAGADATIFPSHGGRFAYSPDQCRDIIVGATAPMGSLRAMVPVPAGGMRLDRVDELVRFYGRDCMLLIGGDLHAQGKDLIQTCQDFEARVTRAASCSRAPATDP